MEQKKPAAKVTDLKSLMQRNKLNKPANTEDVVAVVPSIVANNEVPKEGTTLPVYNI